MRKAVGFIAVTAGAPLVAVAIGAPTAWAAPSGNAGGASVSINGTPHGSPNTTASAVAEPITTGKAPNVAVAIGSSTADPSSARVFSSSGSQAIAIGGSGTIVENGSNDTAVGTGGPAAEIFSVSGVHCHNGGTCT